MDINRTNVLGVGVSAINIPMALEVLDEWIDKHERHYVTVTGVHGVIESQHDEALRRIHNEAGMVTPDGMPLVWLSRRAGYHHVSRVYGPDLMLAVCEHSLKKNYRHYLYGGNEGVPELLAQKLQERFPGLSFAGMVSPPFRKMTPEEDAALVAEINALKPDILWVGLSTPKQERWMAEHVSRLDVPVLIGVGAAFDFHAGLKKQAPRWMQRSGLEWLFRLMTEPKRLWKRYLYNNPQFIWLVMLQQLGLRRYNI
ncbi:MAG TPA: WecB/TagA/CpsF family glycosyltransferase [Anaerolineaceae bacterium]|nr:WecB/TagA/CpsF family glycosyltransferase [Anaerolineaceae bacterium]HPN50714.1 WecB/TagA/CpsF family glycosyltransferase [Anaerolineaceae bacterium]